MKKIKLNVTDAKVLQLATYLKDTGRIRFAQELWDVMGILKQNIRPIKTGIAHFTTEQVRLACDHFNINANWIMNMEDNIYRKHQRKGVNKIVNKKLFFSQKADS